MARPELTGARAKIERAKKHIRDLDAERIAFLAHNPYKVTPEFNVEQGATIYFLDECSEIPISLSLLAGDAAHCLRAALDYLVYSLIPRVAGQGVDRQICFPICESLQEYTIKSPRKTKGMSQSAKEQVDAFKPYGGGNDYLWELHQLDIIDKHRLLMTTAVNVSEMKFGIDAAFVESAFKGLFKLPSEFPKQIAKVPAPEPLFPMKKGAPLYAIKGNFETDKRVDFTFDVAFGEPEVFKGKLLVKTLFELVNLVESLVMSFV